MVSMGLLLCAVGILFIWYLWMFFQKSSLMDSWVETPCMIEKLEIDSSEVNQHYSTKYQMVTGYRYQYDGDEYLGTRYKRLQPASADKEKIEKKMVPFSIGQPSTCWVDPEKPDSAVLIKDSKAAIYSIWFPGLFVLGGLGIIVSALRS